MTLRNLQSFAFKSSPFTKSDEWLSSTRSSIIEEKGSSQEQKVEKKKKLNPMEELLQTVKKQLKESQNKTRNDYGIVHLFQNVKTEDAEHLFGDVHLEMSLEFLSEKPWSMEREGEELRFTKFQYWRPCQFVEYVPKEKRVTFEIQPNMHSRTSDYSRYIQAFSRVKCSFTDNYVNALLSFQSLTQTVKTQMRIFFDQMNNSKEAKNCFMLLQEQFNEQTKEQIANLGKKHTHFVYYYGGTSQQTCDFQIQNFGVSEQMLDVLGTKREDAIQSLMKYGLPFFMSQKTRLERYMYDLEFLINGKLTEQVQEFLTLDEYNIPSSMNSIIYEMKFTPEQLRSIPQNMMMALRIAMHFRVDVYNFEPNLLLQLKVVRESNQRQNLVRQKYFFGDMIFQNELVQKFYSDQPSTSSSVGNTHSLSSKEQRQSSTQSSSLFSSNNEFDMLLENEKKGISQIMNNNQEEEDCNMQIN